MVLKKKISLIINLNGADKIFFALWCGEQLKHLMWEYLSINTVVIRGCLWGWSLYTHYTSVCGVCITRWRYIRQYKKHSSFLLLSLSPWAHLKERFGDLLHPCDTGRRAFFSHRNWPLCLHIVCEILTQFFYNNIRRLIHTSDDDHIYDDVIRDGI
jgi:hypothetical protein